MQVIRGKYFYFPRIWPISWIRWEEWRFVNGVFNWREWLKSLDSYGWKWRNRKLKIPMFLENTSYSVLVDMKEQPATWRVTGGELQQVRERFKREVEDMIREKRDSLERRVSKVCRGEESIRGVSYSGFARRVRFHLRKKEDEFIQENDNIVSASLIYVRLFALNKNKMLRGKYELLGDSARNSILGKILARYVENEVDLRKGALFPDFTLQTPQGESVSLYSVKAKVKDY